MKIVMVAPNFLPVIGGIELVIFNWAKQMLARGHDVHVLTTALKPPRESRHKFKPEFLEAPSEEKIDGIPVHRKIKVLLRNPPFFSNPCQGAFLFIGLGKALDELKPDIIHFHNLGALTLGFVVARHCKKNNIPLIINTYYHPMPKNFKSLFCELNRFTLRMAKKVVAASKLEKKSLIERFNVQPEKIELLPHGIPTERCVDFRLIDKVKRKLNGRKSILYVGRLDLSHRMPELLEAFSLVKKECPETSLLLVGRGDLDGFKSLIERLGLVREEDLIAFGEVPEKELFSCYAASDIFVRTSEYESFGIIFLEAMAFGLPIVAHDTGAVSELVKNGQEGFLVEKNNPWQLAQAFIKLLKNEALRVEMGKNGRSKYRLYIWEALAERIEKVYVSVFGGVKID